MLKIAPNLELPLEAVTQTFGILAMRGAGKTNLARVLAEEMFAARLPFVAVDPVGSWWGLRSSRDGKQSGLEIPIFGGRESDVPLEQTGGQLVADLVARDRMSCILDMSEFGELEKQRFLLDFGDRLYRKNQDALHLFLEEADDYIPQTKSLGGNVGKLLGVWQNIVRRGRARGLGMTLITQRSACINKDVLTQVGTLFTMRVTAPQDRKAIEGWVTYHGQAREILQSLASLENGEFWCYSPEWLRVCARHRARLSRTYDSGATPKYSAARKRPAATLAEIDLSAITAAMSDTIERAKQDDPRELKKTIADLRRHVADLEHKADQVRTEVKTVEVPAITDKDLRVIADAATKTDLLLERLLEIKGRLETLMHGVATGRGVAKPVAATRNSQVPAPPAARRGATPADRNGAKLDKAARMILASLAQYPQGRTRVQAALLAGYSHRGGGYQNALSALRSHELIETRGELLMITDAGRDTLGPYEPLPTGAALQGYWLGQLTKAERSILHALLERYPEQLSREEVAQAAGYEARGGGFQNALSRLRTLELIHGRGSLRASDIFFEE